MTINWVGGMLSILVLCLVLLAGFILQNSVRLFITGKKVQGVVVGMDSSSHFSDSSAGIPLKSPRVEFFTSTGEQIRVSGRSYSKSPSIRVGDLVTVAYNRSNPRNAQLLLWSDFPLIPVGFVLGFAIFILLLWISGILISGDGKMDDPFHLLPAVISHFRLNPFRFPALFILSIVIPLCGLGTFLTSRAAIDLRSNGIRTSGQVAGSKTVSSSLNDGSKGSGVFPMITFNDMSGAPHTIRRSLAKPLSRLKAGDEVEIIYPANNPDKGVVNTWDEFWPPPLFFGFMMLAFIVVFRIVLSGSTDSSRSDPESEKRLRKSGIQAVATVIEANANTHLLHYRIDKETDMPTAKSNDFRTLEISLSDWEPSKAEAEIKKGDQFPVYLDALKPNESFYVDFVNKTGNNPQVQSMEEEEKSYDKDEEETIGKLRTLVAACTPYMSIENISEIEGLIIKDDPALAFEKLFSEIMNLPKPLPKPLQSINWNDCSYLGIKLGLNEECEGDPKFWQEFQKFRQDKK